MQAAVAISYFHRKIGPMVYFSYPQTVLSKEEKTHLADIMDQSYEEGFFTHKFGDLASINYYFEIYSEWARGNKEMLMISFVMDSTPTPTVEELIQNYCIGFIEKLRKNKEIFKAFYEIEDKQINQDDQQIIKKYRQNLRFWVKELYWMGIEELRELTEEEKWAAIMARAEIFKVIQKLSKGPLPKEDLEKWFKPVFPLNDLDVILEILERESFVFINTIGHDTYVLLVKEVSIMRVPPAVIIDLEEDSPELADLLIIYINEVRDFFEAYNPSPMDSLVLFRLFANPKLYNVISQLREGPLPKEKILSMVSEASMKDLLKNLELLEQHEVIQSFYYGDVFLYLLKTDVVLTYNFPQYLKKLLPKEINDYQAKSYSHQNIRLKQTINEELPFEEIHTKLSPIPPLNPLQDELIRSEKNSSKNKNGLNDSSKIDSSDPEERHQHIDFQNESDEIKQQIKQLQQDLLKNLED